MTTLREGSWNRTIDEKDRFPVPAKVRKGAGKVWILAIDPFRHGHEVVLFPLEIWRKKMVGTKDQQQLWHPYKEELDPQGRVTVPHEIKELAKLGPKIKVISMGDHLLVKNILAEKEMISIEQLRSFLSPKEAEDWLSRGDNVAYYNRPDRLIVGKFTAGNGFNFSFLGKDKNDVIVPVRDIFCNFYPLRPAEINRKMNKKVDISEDLLNKFPDFNPQWPDEKKNKWFDAFEELLKRVAPNSEEHLTAKIS